MKMIEYPKFSYLALIFSFAAIFLLVGCNNQTTNTNSNNLTNESSCSTSQTEQAGECPRGMVNDPAPGSCWLYKDENKNELCDLSEVK